MSYGKVFVYVMAPPDAATGPAKIGTTKELARRRCKIRRMFKDRWRCMSHLRDSEFYWIAPAEDLREALYVEARVKEFLGRKYQYMNDWIDLPAAEVAETAHNFIDWMRTGDPRGI
jgi:predicted GIY-YIG superfamily endonuclease